MYSSLQLSWWCLRNSLQLLCLSCAVGTQTGQTGLQMQFHKPLTEGSKMLANLFQMQLSMGIVFNATRMIPTCFQLFVHQEKPRGFFCLAHGFRRYPEFSQPAHKPSNGVSVSSVSKHAKVLYSRILIFPPNFHGLEEERERPLCQV